MSNSELGRTLLQIENLYAGYTRRDVLCGISLSIKYGEIVGVIGGNGSGKSTLLKTIAGVLRPTSGWLAFDGQDVSHQPISVRQRLGIGYLLQGGRIFPNLSVSENYSIAIAHSPCKRDGSCPFDGVNRKALLGDLFPDLKGRARDLAASLSGGLRQMLAIEMVFAQRPRLALLDEPTGPLAPNVVHAMLESIVAFTKGTGCAVLLVEQNTVEARRITDRILRLDHGKCFDAQNLGS